mmetsp:Transcript_53261/g.155140  ORF Transcript_53261/g.155140 Transcript_53261/m.155140 type:complete len:213 (+) Transcript_53261:1031-1669(+)
MDFTTAGCVPPPPRSLSPARTSSIGLCPPPGPRRTHVPGSRQCAPRKRQREAALEEEPEERSEARALFMRIGRGFSTLRRGAQGYGPSVSVLWSWTLRSDPSGASSSTSGISNQAASLSMTRWPISFLITSLMHPSTSGILISFCTNLPDSLLDKPSSRDSVTVLLLISTMSSECPMLCPPGGVALERDCLASAPHALYPLELRRCCFCPSR